MSASPGHRTASSSLRTAGRWSMVSSLGCGPASASSSARPDEPRTFHSRRPVPLASAPPATGPVAFPTSAKPAHARARAGHPAHAGTATERLRKKLNARWGTPDSCRKAARAMHLVPRGRAKQWSPPVSLSSAASAKRIARGRRKSIIQLAAAASASTPPEPRSDRARASGCSGSDLRGTPDSRKGDGVKTPGSASSGAKRSAKPVGKAEKGRKAADAADIVRQTKATQRRQGQQRAFFSGTKVSSVHGTLIFGHQEGNPDPAYVPKLIEQTGFSRRELYAMWMQFKALVSLSSSLEGIDKSTFLRGIPMLRLEDRAFVERVFSLLDEDASGIIEWDEFLTALTKLTHGSPLTRASFLFDVYDDDGGGTIDDDEMMHYFLASLRLSEETASPFFKDVCKYFVSRVLHDIDPDHSGHLDRKKIVQYLKDNPGTTNISGMFGRATVEGAAVADVLAKRDIRLEEMRLTEDAHLPLEWTNALKAEKREKEETRRRVREAAEAWREKKRRELAAKAASPPQKGSKPKQGPRGPEKQVA